MGLTVSTVTLSALQLRHQRTLQDMPTVVDSFSSFPWGFLVFHQLLYTDEISGRLIVLLHLYAIKARLNRRFLFQPPIIYKCVHKGPSNYMQAFLARKKDGVEQNTLN